MRSGREFFPPSSGHCETSVAPPAPEGDTPQLWAAEARSLAGFAGRGGLDRVKKDFSVADTTFLQTVADF